MNYQIIRLIDEPEMKIQMANWFHEKWGVPLDAYLESMTDCIAGNNAVPQWYAAIENGQMIGGLGVIENDFHNRKDLSPNICAVYVEESKRCNGIAGALLKYVCCDMKEKNGKWVFCRHKDRDTYEIPGVHRESGETIFETAKRELMEETGLPNLP